MKDRELERKLKQKLMSLLDEVDKVGPTPLRQLLDAHLVICYNAIATFDQGAYETSEVYAEKVNLASKQANNLDISPWK